MKTLFTIIILFAGVILISRDIFAQGTVRKAKPITLGAADTLYFNSKWDKARVGYEANTAQHPEKISAITWNRLGYCYQNLGNYQAALKTYKKAIDAKPQPGLKPVLTSRMSRSYARLNERDQALIWLDTAVRAGYSFLMEMDTSKDYNSIRNEEKFKKFRETVYSVAYPCTVNPKNREFDFWVGEWNVFQTGSTAPQVGKSIIQNVSGGCMILENWTGLMGAYNGKSMNYYDIVKGKWEQDWMGSDGNITRFLNGEYTDGAMRFTYDAKQPDGKFWPGRFTFFNQGANQVRQFAEQSPDEGKTWQTVYDFTYVRKLN
jgi:tetratricopeptide (TPR) repeat protein